jgi:hypothetical protein
MARFREEVLNVKLAELLKERGLKADPEVIQGKLPDVRVVIGGLILILEGKSSSKTNLMKQAKDRVNSGLANISIAIEYPPGLNEADDIDILKANLANSRYDGKIFYWSSEGISELPLNQINIDEMVESINHIYSLYIKNHLLSDKVQEIGNKIDTLAGRGTQTSIHFHAGNVEKKLKEALGLGEED